MMTQEFTYSTVFKNIKPKTIEATKELIKAGIWKADVSDSDKAIIMGLWLKKVSAIYNMETPEFYFVTGQEGEEGYRGTGGGCYYPVLNKMYVYKKPSLTTLLHEFRHAMQAQRGVLHMFRNDPEEDARAWSVSLYKLSAPKSYQRACDRGLMHFK